MKTYSKLILIAGSMLTMASCTKVIDVNLNNAEKKYVIEAVLTDQPGTCQVQITQTKNFNEDNTFAGVTGAVVTITDSVANTVTTLTETKAGIYEAPNLTGATGKTYKLNVDVNGQHFAGSSVMPVLVNFDSLYVSDEELFGDIYKTANVMLHDPEGKGNAYRYQQYRNGKKIKQIYVRDDDYTDGRDLNAKLYIFDDNEEEDANGDPIRTVKGDTLTIDVMCIDTRVYKYWYSLDQSATGTGNSAAPANPVTNITGGALGYFSAQTLQSKTVVVE